MIRIDPHMPNMLRLRIRAHLAASQAARQVNGFRQDVLRRLSHDTVPCRHFTKVIARGASRGVPAEIDQEVTMKQFEAHYQRLIDLLCWSAKDGVAPDKQARYTELREWFFKHYATMRPWLTPFMDPADAAPGAEAPRDSFEHLFWSPNLETVINSHEMIQHIIQTRTAVEALREENEPVLA